MKFFFKLKKNIYKEMDSLRVLSVKKLQMRNIKFTKLKSINFKRNLRFGSITRITDNHNSSIWLNH